MGFTAILGDFITADRIITLDATNNFTISGANLLTLDVTSGSPTINTLQDRTLTLNADGTYQTRINGTSAGTQYDQLTAGDSVTLDGPLDLIADSGLSAGQSFILLNKTSAGAIGGSFAGKPEGSLFTEDGYNWIITYLGGDGNDVVLTLASPLQVWRYTCREFLVH